jgi:3-hexulose-6-phosphate synthase/6-phospho-3-hexuloisomerase
VQTDKILQVALDFVVMQRAMNVAREAVAGGIDWLEVGTPLLKAEGLEAVRALKAEFPDHTVVADTKTMDAGRIEFEAAAKASAGVAVVMGAASESTIRECIEAGRNYGIKVAVDLLNVEDYVARARQVEQWGADIIYLHCPIDDQMRGLDPFEKLRELAPAVSIPVCVAGGLNSESVVDAVEAGASILIAGGSIIKSADARSATRAMREAVETGVRKETDLYKRIGEDKIRDALIAASTANISDGNHRLTALEGIRPLIAGKKCAGPAVTVRTAPGDWSKPVLAIDEAQPGDVIVIDAGGVPPAVWGELATLSAKQKEIAGVVVNGVIRDSSDIMELDFPIFSKGVFSRAGEPKGFGEIGAPLRFSGVSIIQGDWIVADNDGVLVLPRSKAAEMANRGMDCLETENCVRQEILSGKSTLGQVQQLLRWEKKG